MELIKAENLSAKPGEEEIKNLSFSLGKGEILSVAGLENSGIYLLSKIMAALTGNYEGSVKILGDEPKNTRNYLSEVGVFLPNSAFYEELTGKGMIEYSLLQRGLKKNTERLNYLKERLGITEGLLKSKVRRYSTYETHAIDLLITHMGDSKLSVLFDPTSGLREHEKQNYMEFIEEERKKGKSFFILTPFSGTAREFSENVIYLEKGERVSQEVYEEERKKERKIIREKLTGGKIS